MSLSLWQQCLARLQDELPATEFSAFMGASNVFLGDCKTDTGMPQRIQAAENGNLRRASPLWLLEDECELTGS